MSDWISVKDKMPELEQVVMVCWPSGFDGRPLYSFGARLDDSEGWVWGVSSMNHIDPSRDASWNIEADDDYPIQFWKPLDMPPPLEKAE